jgi:hypothetical protein
VGRLSDLREPSSREKESARMSGSIIAVVAISCAAFMAGVYGRRAAADRLNNKKRNESG